MIETKALQADIETLLRLIEKQFGFRAKDLRKAMRRIGRRLPKKAHRQAAVLIEASQKAQHPKLAVQLNSQVIEAAYRDLMLAVKTYDRAKIRKTAVLDQLTGLALNMFAVLVILCLILYWRGFL